MEKFVGDYLFNNEMKVQIRKSPKGLTVQTEGRPTMELITLSNAKLDFPAFRSTLHFKADKNGNFIGADIFQGNDKAGQLEKVEFVEEGTIDIKQFVGHYYSSELDLLFIVSSSDGQLIINDSKHGSIKLKAKTKNIFQVQSQFANTIVFRKNEQGVINQLFLNSGSRARNMKFSKSTLR